MTAGRSRPLRIAVFIGAGVLALSLVPGCAKHSDGSLTGLSALTGAAPASRQPGTPSTAAILTNQVKKPDDNFVGLPGVPEDAYRVVMAMTLRLKGFSGKEIARTAGVKEAARLAPPPGLDVTMFGSQRVRFSRYEPLDGEPEGRRIAGILDMQDTAGRRLSANFEASYRAADGALVLERTSWRFEPSAFPELDFFVIPARHLAEALENGDVTYRNLRRTLAKHAVDLEKPRTWPQGRQRYLIVVMVKDRVAPEAKLVMGVSRERGGPLRETGNVRLYRFNGWPVAVMPGRFAIDGPRFWVKVELTKESLVSEKKARKSRLIGLYAMARRD